jgi:hypothetical protein
MNEILTDMEEHDEMKKKAIEIVSPIVICRQKNALRTMMLKKVRSVRR